MRHQENSQRIKQIELEKRKYFLFLSIKHDILKLVKDQQLDVIVKELRKRKLAKSHCMLTKLIQMIRHLHKMLVVKRQHWIKANHRFLCSFRVMLHTVNCLDRRFGKDRVPGTLARRSTIRPQLTMCGFVMVRSQ